MLISFQADRLRAFVAVARESGFSRAARRLGVSQSAVSQSVAQLERELGEQLFVRDGRAVHLTDAGQVLLVRAERAFGELEAARVELEALRQVASGRLRIGASDTLATYLLPPVFAAFRDRYPGVELQLVNRPSPAVAELVGDRLVDLGVVSLPLSRSRRLDSAVRIEEIADQSDLLIVPADHRLAGRRWITMARVADHPLLLLDRTTATRAFLDQRFRDAGASPRVVMEMSSVELLKRLVELGFGVSIVPAIAAAREVSQGTLAAVAVRELTRSRQIGLLTPAAGPTSHAARAFAELTRQLVAGETTAG